MDRNLKKHTSKKYLYRKRINKLLTPMDGSNLITITAQTGYGKTRSMIRYLSEKQVCIIWVLLTAYDNYSSHFWKSLISSVKEMNIELGVLMGKQSFPSDSLNWDKFLILFNSLSCTGKSIVFVFDDLHRINNPIILEFIEHMITLKKTEVCFYLISQSSVFPGKENVLMSSLTLTETELAFTEEEIACFFIHKELRLPHEMIQNIRERTKGWPCGIYLIGLSLQKIITDAGGFLTFTNVLAEEVIEQEIFADYSCSEQNFLTRLSLLENAPAALLETVFQDEISQYGNFLESCFFVRSNHYSKVVQIHQIFRKYLSRQREQLAESVKRSIYQKSGNWYEEQGLYPAALSCYRKGRDYAASKKVLTAMLPGCFNAESVKVLVITGEEISHSFEQERMMLQVAIYAWQFSIGRGAMMEPDLQRHLIRELSVLPQLPKHSEMIGSAYINLGFYYMSLGDLRFESCFHSARNSLNGREPLQQAAAMFLLNHEGFALRPEGELELLLVALERTEPDYTYVLGGGLTGLMGLVKALAYFYRGNMADAKKYARQAIKQGSMKNQMDIVCHAYFLLLKIGLYLGTYELIRDSLARMEIIIRDYPLGNEFRIPDIAKGWLYASLEFYERIPEWIIREPVVSPDEYGNVVSGERIIRAWMMLNEKRTSEVLPYMEQSIAIYSRLHKYIFLLQAHMLQAIACYNIRDYDRSFHELYLVYGMSWKNEIILPLCVFGKQTRKFMKGVARIREKKLDQLSGQSQREVGQISQAWLDKIIGKANTSAKRINVLQNQFIKADPQIKNTKTVLAAKEIAILQAFCEGLTREETADSLGISSHTVKSMTRQIYAKLGAVNGAHAVRIAVQNKII